MRVVSGLVLAAIFALGLVRLVLEDWPRDAIDSKTALEIAQCMAVSKELPANLTMTAASFAAPASEEEARKPMSAEESQKIARRAAEEADKAAKQAINERAACLANPQDSVDLSRVPAQTLCFLTTGPVQIELADATARETIQKGASYTLTQPEMVSVASERGNFEFNLDQGSMLVNTGDGGRFLLTTKKPVRFSGAPKLSYRVGLDKGIKIESKEEGEKEKKKVALLPTGTRGWLDIGRGQSLVSLQPLPVSPWLEQTLPTLVPARALGQQGLSELTIEARQTGTSFSGSGFALAACARSTRPNDKWTQIGVVETKSQSTGAATIRLAVPSTVLPAFPGVDSIILPVRVAVASLDGQYRAYGGFSAFAKGYIAIAAVLIAAMLFYWLATLRGAQVEKELEKDREQTVKTLTDRGDSAGAAAVQSKPLGTAHWFVGLFMGPDRDPSLSLFQIFFWTVITVWGLLYVYGVTGSLLTMTASMMALLGIAGVGSVAARWVAAANAPEGSGSQAPGAQSDPAKGFQFWQMLSTNGSFDLLKLQLFVFTLTIGTYVVWRIADTAAFPELDANTLLLLGVSQGVYIGGKVAGGTGLSKAQALKVELDTRKKARDLIGTIDAATRADYAANYAALETKKKAGPLDPTDQAKFNQLSKVKEADELDKVIADLNQKLTQAAKDLGLIPA